MKFSMYLSKAVAFVIALFQKQFICLSNKPTTLCGRTGDSLRSPTGLHSLGGISTEFKVRFAPPTVCRRTIWNNINIPNKFSKLYNPHIGDCTEKFLFYWGHFHYFSI
jgi:putative membrane protein